MISRTPRYTRTDTFFPCTTRFRSRRVIFRDATVRWVDQSRGAPALVLRHVTLTLGSHDRTHDFSLSAVPPDGLGKRLDLRGIFSAPSASAMSSPPTVSGRLYARVDAADAARWSPWLDLPDSLESARADLQVWAAIKQGRIDHVASTLDLRDVPWV